MKRVGLIAGPSTEATVLYFRKFDEEIRDRFDASRPVGILANSINGRAFEEAMERNELAQARRLCVDAAQQCAAAGVHALLLGNSQLHIGADAIRSSVNLPIIDLIDATLTVAATTGIRRVALLGVRFATENAIWQKRCADYGLMASIPPADAAARVNIIVKEELSRGFVDGASKAELVRACSDFRRNGSRAVVLVAPELRLALDEGDSALPILDATTAHVSAAIDWTRNAVCDTAPLPR